MGNCLSRRRATPYRVRQSRDSASDSASASPECRALRCHSDSLITAIANPLDLAWKLFAKEIIEEATVDRVSLPNQTNRDKNSILVLAVMRRVEARPSLFPLFLDLLKDSRDHILRELGGKLETTYSELHVPINGKLSIQQ